MRWISLGLIILLGIDLIIHRPVDQVAFLQVGQGDATLISRDGTNLLVDAGPRSDNFDGGQRFVWPELHRRSIRKIDAVFLTHFDRDHYGGLQAILKRVQVDRVIVVAPDGISNGDRVILGELGVLPDQLVVITSATRLDFGSLSVDAVPGLSGAGVDDNSQSPYLGISYGLDRIILTGDAPGEVEDKWIRDAVPRGNIVKAGHHGSNRSLTDVWVQALRPEFVVFSCGRNNTWGHPTLGALNRAEESGAKVLRTDSMGTVEFVPDSLGRLRLVTSEDRPAILQFFQR